jgi:hypothetical protein
MTSLARTGFVHLRMGASPVRIQAMAKGVQARVLVGPVREERAVKAGEGARVGSLYGPKGSLG